MDEKPQRKETALFGCAGVVGGIFLVGWLITAISQTGSAPPRPTYAGEIRRVQSLAFCTAGVSRDDVAVRAMANKDMDGVAALIRQGRLIGLAKGTEVRVIRAADGWAAVDVLSGEAIGKTCNMPSALIGIIDRPQNDPAR